MKVIAATFLAALVTVSAHAITPEQCQYFATEGKVAICHATGSEQKPFALIRVALEACMSGHANHSTDFVSPSGEGCDTDICLPQAAPCDETLQCCQGLTCSAGRCEPIPVCAPAGGACAAHHECCSGNCDGGTCQ